MPRVVSLKTCLKCTVHRFVISVGCLSEHTQFRGRIPFHADTICDPPLGIRTWTTHLAMLNTVIMTTIYQLDHSPLTVTFLTPLGARHDVGESRCLAINVPFCPIPYCLSIIPAPAYHLPYLPKRHAFPTILVFLAIHVVLKKIGTLIDAFEWRHQVFPVSSSFL